MAKTYEDISRRGLIKLGHDFDRDNEAALQRYLAENGENYENIRTVEKVIVRADQITETVKEAASRLKTAASGSSGIVKKIIINEADKFIDTVISTVANTANMAEDELSGLKEDLKYDV